MKVAINGFGRIGRIVFRLLQERKDLTVVAINDITDNEALAYLLRHDTVLGHFKGRAEIVDGDLVTDQGTVRMTSERNPRDLPWAEMGVDFVVESTGVFRERAQIAQHLEAGAKKVLLTVPAKDEIDATIVLGVNNDDLRPEHQIVSNASCTTNCLAPMAAVLDREFGITSGQMTTIHAYTGDQRLIDTPHSDWRRARAAAENIIPTTTGAASAVGKVLPKLDGKLDGIAVRVPVPCGSMVDLVTVMDRDITAEEVNDAMRAAAESDQMRGIMSYALDPMVSSDVIGDSHSCVFDPDMTAVSNGNLLKTVGWYDNESGYSSRVCDLLELMAKVG
ncbi:MAG: glyceraldehyde 3-phosphate dehydrogenase [Candidatus Krumholzibacteriia bacterium]|jgi:glyceraldehyde 3-phosphate dehydrogenase